MIRSVPATALGLVLALASPMVVPSHAIAGAEPVYTGFLSNVAADGHDVVAYFTEGRPVEGSTEFTQEYNGATWRFASAENRDAFAAKPEAYAPQFGGYCAWAVSQGSTAKGDPDYWRIVDDKLYLNYNADVQTRWEADIPGFITAAEGKWPGLLAE